MQSDSGLGRAIQVRRAELGLKRKDLARLASLSYPYLSELENGSKAPSAKALAQLAGALQLSPADLLAFAEAMAAAPGARDVGPYSADTSSPVPERWKRLATEWTYRAGPLRGPPHQSRTARSWTGSPSLSRSPYARS